jgi:hypothetical protein
MQTSDAMRREKAKLYPPSLRANGSARSAARWLAMTWIGRSVPARPPDGMEYCIFAVQQSFREGTLLTGNGNSDGLSVLVQLACKLRNLRSRAPGK